MLEKAQTCEFPLSNKVGKTLRIKSINKGVLEIVSVILVFVQRFWLGELQEFDARQTSPKVKINRINVAQNIFVRLHFAKPRPMFTFYLN